MATSVRDLRLLLDDFVAGAPLMAFWNSFMEHMETFAPERELSPAGRREYDALAELVYASAAGPADAGRGEAALRERLRDVRLETSDGRMV